MAQGLVGSGQTYRDRGFQGLEQVARREEERNQFNEQAEAQKKQSAIGLAATGATVGASVGGPWGALAGFVIGGIGGLLM